MNIHNRHNFNCAISFSVVVILFLFAILGCTQNASKDLPEVKPDQTYITKTTKNHINSPVSRLEKVRDCIKRGDCDLAQIDLILPLVFKTEKSRIIFFSGSWGNVYFDQSCITRGNLITLTQTLSTEAKEMATNGNFNRSHNVISYILEMNDMVINQPAPPYIIIRTDTEKFIKHSGKEAFLEKVYFCAAANQEAQFAIRRLVQKYPSCQELKFSLEQCDKIQEFIKKKARLFLTKYGAGLKSGNADYTEMSQFAEHEVKSLKPMVKDLTKQWGKVSCN